MTHTTGVQLTVQTGDSDGLILVNGGNRRLEGQNLLSTKDTNGKLFIKEFIETVTTKGSGWVDYMWPKPGRAASAQKIADSTAGRAPIRIRGPSYIPRTFWDPLFFHSELSRRLAAPHESFRYIDVCRE